MKKIGPSGLGKLAEMICGDAPYTYFPYRSSSYLTRFFEDLDLDYRHDGTTRRFWVRAVLSELNERPTGGESMPPNEMVIAIEYLLHPDHFTGFNDVNHDKAIEAVNNLLKAYELVGNKDLNTHTVELRPLYGEYASTASKQKEVKRVITFSPEVFEVPAYPPQEQLVSVMMPFRAEFDQTYETIRLACQSLNLSCFRADDIWENTTFIQDIFELIYASRVVVVDFSGRNPNVMYETGVAHTLGKQVIPISQFLEDVPSDLRHHRCLKYLPNSEGYQELEKELWSRLRTLTK